MGGDNGGSGTAFVDYAYVYDILDNQIEMREEVSDSEDLITRYRYDPNENQVLVIQPEGNATASVYDERDLLLQNTRGATLPPPLALLGGVDLDPVRRHFVARSPVEQHDLGGAHADR